MKNPEQEKAVEIMVNETHCTNWEQAYLAQSHDASVGRLFRGLIHNLSGTLQVFSLQTDLFAMMLGQADELLQQLLATNPQGEAGELVLELQRVLHKRSGAVSQMQEKVRSGEEIVRRTLLLPDFKQLAVDGPYTVNRVVDTEVEFLCADSFFKHKVRKELLLDNDLPSLAGHHLVIHQVLFRLLENSLEALRGMESPCLAVKTAQQESAVMVEVEDNGPGIPAADLPRIFEPFFTTWENHQGLGLYLAEKLAGQCGGTLMAESSPGRTIFRLRLPA